METSGGTYGDLLNHFLTLCEGGGTGASLACEDPSPPPEILIQTIWRGQILQGDKLRTQDGQTVEVLDPGRHQTGGPGPDFRSAQILLGGREVVGDIEIHGDAADWRRHQHDRDFEYNGVVLHVTLTASDGQTLDYLQNGTPIPRLLLEGRLDPDLPGALASARELLLGEESEGQTTPGLSGQGCRLAVAQMGSQSLRHLLARASDERLLRKIQRLRTLGSGTDSDQILHQALLTGLGQKSAKTLWFLLSRRLPIRDIWGIIRDLNPEDHAPAMEALLLGVAGLLPPDIQESEEISEPDAQHRAVIRSWWAQFRGMFQDRALPTTRRWFGQVRPPGFPARRIAAYAAILARSPAAGLPGTLVLQRVRELAKHPPTTARDWRKTAANLGRWMVVQLHPYWDRHCSWGGKPLPQSMALLGDDQADGLAFNALIPWALMVAENDQDAKLAAFLRDLYGQFPALPSNSVTRYMESRLFGGKAPPEIPMKLERYRQGLIQMFTDCCNHPAFGQCAMMPQG